MRRALLIALSLATALSSACAMHVVSPPALAAGTTPPATTDRIRVLEPADVTVGTTLHVGSGGVVAIRTAEGLRFAGYPDVTVIHVSKEPDARKAALAVHARFLVVPTILEWIDHATIFAPNSVRIRLDLEDLAADGRTVNTITFTAHSWRLLRKPSTYRLLDDTFLQSVATLVRPSNGGG